MGLYEETEKILRKYGIRANKSLGQNFLISDTVVENIIESADTAVNSKSQSVNLRYGHDSILMPLSCLLELDNFGLEINDLEDVAALGWHDYKVVPMGGNIQIVFYRPAADQISTPENVLVKVLLNEVECVLPLQPVEGPYYKWSDLREYYLKKLGS